MQNNEFRITVVDLVINYLVFKYANISHILIIFVIESVTICFCMLEFLDG